MTTTATRATRVGCAKTRATWTLTLALLTLPALGCVKKSEYEALKAKSAENDANWERELKGALADGVSLKEALAAEEGRNAELSKQLEELKASLEKAESDHAALLNDRTKLAASVEDMKTALASLEAQRKLSEARVAEYRKLLGRFKQLIDAGKLRVKIVNGRMVVELPSDILFASGSVDISKDGTEAIQETAKILSEMGDRKFQIEGHTDDQPIKTARFPNNWALAAGRAIAVLEVMVGAGMRRANLSAASYADVVPAASNKSKKSRAKNRRIEIAMVPDFSVLPGFDELQKLSKP